ncbi:hypothetical protein HYS93_04515 [Candidatus Daviesbacteria bacterium]|nr:hypothetical protein [Candidatus Daviesbacteria bacterium]
MEELINGIISIPFISQLANLHGLLAMLSLVFFGSSFALYFFSNKIKDSIRWLKLTLAALFTVLVLLDLMGLIIYVPYRSVGGAKSLLVASKDTAWLHEIIFEHKEFLAYAPPLLIFSALFIVLKLGDSFTDNQKYRYLRLAVINSSVLALIFVLVVAAEAVLVTKAAPL